jgi:signal transduction histidine kinase
MEDIQTRPITSVNADSVRRALPQALTIVLLLAALLVFLAVPFLALRWMQAPFLGAFVEQTLFFNDARPPAGAHWPAYAAGLGQAAQGGPFQIAALDGQPVGSSAELERLLRRYAPGDVVTLSVRALGAHGAKSDVRLGLVSFGLAERLHYFYIPYLIGLVYLVSAVWVFAVRRRHAAGRAYALFAVSVALALGLLFDLFTTHVFSALWTLAVALVGGAAVQFALRFPSDDPALHRRPGLAWASVLAGLVISVPALVRLRDLAHPTAYLAGWRAMYLVTAAAIVFVLAWSAARWRRGGYSHDREQARLVLLAALLSFLPLGAWLAASALFGKPDFSALLLVFLAVFPVLAVYMVQRYRALQADRVLSLGLRYGLLTVMVTLAYALAAAGLGLGAAGLLAPNQPVLAGFLFFVLALLLNPLRAWTQRLVDQAFFRNRRAYQDRLQTFSGELTRVVDLPGILVVLRRYVQDTLAPARLHIFLYDALSDQYRAAPGEDGQPTSDLRFPITSGLAIRLGEQRAPLLLNEYDSLPAALEPDRSRLLLLAALAFVPLPGRQRLSGWMALGPRLSGEPYTSVQLGFADALCDQAALAIERAQVVANMENRVREMNVLTRVAQGINITLSLDDILELVYAQTVQILPATFFSIMLHDRALDVYQYVFYLEADDRIASMENSPVATGRALEQEVIRQRRAVRVEDYNRERKQRGLSAERPGLLAWLGVPLNAGAETIGALSLGSADPGVEYTPEQQALLQAIADQVAGALVKARLLQETDRRARQLATLNEVTRQLTSTLETEPLLQSILQSAVDILNCEAGSLLLVEEAADVLVFRSVVGPVAGDLLHKRMPADRGVVGKSVKTARPIIVNDVNAFPEWFSKPDQETGFITRALLVIPLMVKERVIGVVEVINKKDGTIFSRDDQDLLSAFASQAAVAMENARLYTNTDQALAARVEELSVMQRIDRELNAGLDTSRAMRITLEWAMRQSGAHAGLVGVLPAAPGAEAGKQSAGPGSAVGQAGVLVMAHEGCARAVEPYLAALLPAAEFGLQPALLAGLPQRRALDLRVRNPGDPSRALLDDGCSQAIIPIRREAETIGVLLLESRAALSFSEESMSFLVRLCDHASIAISNAQLYAEVQQANLAKSDFVSFVAHELKNPMTSVKGYTELIAAGAVGPVNDAQANFLGTIRANIERMNTLVSDLNDMSKIEVGRLRLDFKPLRLSDSIETAVRSTRRQIEEKQQVLTLAIPGDLPPVWADRIRLEQVLVNLISNAHKYTPAGGALEIAAERCPNQWDPAGASEVVHIWVKDNGIGIAAEDQKKIFQKFFRSDDPKTREVAGTGLGLNITRSLVEMQGGKVWFDSVFRQGTTFHVTVPISET